MSVRKVQVGQVWKKADTNEQYLVTKVYSEVLATYAVLRKAGAESEARARVRVENAPDGQSLPGFVYAQEAEEF
jgi:hypothetical protein